MRRDGKRSQSVVQVKKKVCVPISDSTITIGSMFVAPEALAGRSTAVRSAGANLERALLTPDEWANLPATGRIDPTRIRFSQDSISDSFQAPHGSIDEFAHQLGRTIDPASVKPVRLVVRNGGVYSLDNRRLYAFQQAGFDIPYVRLDGVPNRELFKFTTQNDGASIRVRRGS